MLTFFVSKEEEGEKLLSFLRKNIQYPVKWIKRGIEGRLCRINGRVEVFSTHPLKAGQKITYDDSQMSSFEKARKEIPKPAILYEDDELLIIDKPSGITSEEIKGNYFLVHRLDKGTSGALILAKTDEMQEKMKALFKKKAVKKAYLAIVDGTFEEKKGTIDIPLGMKRRVQDQIYWGPVPLKRGGKEALTDWYCLKNGQEAALVRCFPQTGRTHQIRIHLKEIGHPILGDDQYSKHFLSSYPAPRILLHASYLSFIQPVSKKLIEIKTPLPSDFQKAIKILRLYH